jgi:glycosyltransferase involved in cell wall biosynthesis
MKKIFVMSAILLYGSLLNSTTKMQNINKKPEEIYAVMITGKDDFHKSLAEKSIQSFLLQTYPNKHLIIINDGNYSLGDSKCDLITEIKLDKKHILGALRNIGIKQIPKNGIYVQWDDDDWHHPDLMAKQYNYMMSKTADGCILQREVMYCFHANVAWVSSPDNGKIGTIMCRMKGDVFYPELAKAEDDVFLSDYQKKYKVVTWNNPPLYYLRFVHGHNTWDDEHFNIKRFRKNTWLLPESARCYLSKIVPLYGSLK